MACWLETKGANTNRWQKLNLLNTLSKSKMSFERDALAPLVARLKEPRRFLQVVPGPRQLGNTTTLAHYLDLWLQS
jgi:predicted AAA+ superfamily ATPase